jgi:O-antigen/teichoic acid export membrane protein
MHQNVVIYVKRLLKHSSIYGVGTLLYRAVALVLVPLYTRHLTMSEYGDLELLFITSSFLIMILQFGMGSENRVSTADDR